MKVLTIFVTLSLMLVALYSQLAQDSPRLKLRDPIAIHKGASSDLFVLDAGGTVHRLQKTQDHFDETSAFSLKNTSGPIDMTYALFNRQDSLIISSFQVGIATLAQYASDGKLLNNWILKHVCSGVDVDNSNGALYVATSDSNEVYKIDLRTRRTSYVGEIHSAKRLGPLVLGPNNQIIYIADVAGGSIYEFSLVTGNSRKLISGMSSPSAFFFDLQTRRLYIADNGQRKIFTIDTSVPQPVLMQFASKPLSSPSGIAPRSPDGLAVTDEDTNSVLFFSSQGIFLNRFPR